MRLAAVAALVSAPLVFATSLATSLAASSAQAQTTPAGPRADEHVRARTAFLDSRLRAGEISTARWAWAWVSVYTALAAGNYVIAGLSDSRDARVDFIARGTLSTIGLVTTIALWPASASATEAPRAVPGDTPAQRSSKLGAYETSLERAARGDAFGTSWKAHVIGFGVNALAGGAIAVLDERPKQGALVFAGGFLVAEIKVFTRPTPSLRTKDAYERLESAPLVTSFAIVPTTSGAMAFGCF